MKQIKRLFVAIIAFFAIAGTASAQISFGVKAGAKINDFRFKSESYGDTYNPGFTCGLMLEYMFPKTNVGIDASIMYFNVKTKIEEYVNTPHPTKMEYPTHFIDVPVNFKWKVLNKPVTPFLTTGPSLLITGGERQVSVNRMVYKSALVDWNFGVGVELFKTAQVGVNYGLAMMNAFQTPIGRDIDSKKNSWTITATYIF